MSQHDFDLANAAGASFRSDANNALQALASLSSGASEPSTRYAYQWWADTTTGLLKIRNAANSAWVTVGTLASTNLGISNIPSGTVMLFVQTAAPTGWTKLVARNDYGIRVVSGTASQNDAGIGFSTAFASQAVAGTVGNTSLTSAQLPTDAVIVPGGNADQGATGSTGRGSGNTHTHSFTGTAINLAINYIDVIQASKD